MSAPKKVTKTSAAEFEDYFQEQQSSSSGDYAEWFATRSTRRRVDSTQGCEGSSPFEVRKDCSKSSYHGGGSDSRLYRSPKAEEADVVVVIAGDAIYILYNRGTQCYGRCGGESSNFERPASGSKTPPGQQMARAAAQAAEAEAEAGQKQKRSRKMQL